MKLDITEQDLFNYVFFPESLSPEIIHFFGNSKEFSDEIEFFIELKSSINKELSLEEKRELADRKQSYHFNKIIILSNIRLRKK
ncbi:MAG: hypothetical protein ACUVRG_11310 [Ignavibacterium sp.]|uniref:hypothetical protein n=1 Tax=Ignavibacterium sp. TaxID=2651167 RepID=UPI00404A29F1